MAALVILRATQIKTYSWGNAQVVLVGNKVDLEEERQVPNEDAQRLATELGQHTHTHTYYRAAHVFVRLIVRTRNGAPNPPNPNHNLNES